MDIGTERGKMHGQLRDEEFLPWFGKVGGLQCPAGAELILQLILSRGSFLLFTIPYFHRPVGAVPPKQSFCAFAFCWLWPVGFKSYYRENHTHSVLT